MRVRFFVLLPLLAFMTAAASAPQAGDDTDTPPGHAGTPPHAGFQVFGYHAWWMRDTWRTYDFQTLDKIMFFELRASWDGTLTETYEWPSGYGDLIARAKATHTPIVPTIAVLDEQAFNSLFTSQQHMDALLNNAMEVVQEAGADGVHLNFEMFAPVSQAVRGNLTAFVQHLRRRLDAYRPDAELTIFTPGFDYPDVYDERALAQAADYLVVQGYDMHWSNGPTAGPLSPITGWDGVNWGAIVKRYLDLGVPRSKIVMTIPYYGYEWPTVSGRPGAPTRGTAETITYAPVNPDYLPLIQINAEQRIAQYGMHRDPVSQSPYYVYQGTDGWHQGWYEDAQSLAAKCDFVRREGLAGVAIFLLGYDGGELMKTLR